MKINGEDILVTNRGEMAAARAAAIKISTSRNHGWANIIYIDSQFKRLCRDIYSDGRLVRHENDMLRFPGNIWFSVGTTRGLTVLDALVRYAECDFVRLNAQRLGGTGEYRR